MSGKLLLKAMVFGAIAFTSTAVGFAANIQDTNSMDSVQQTVVTDEAKRDAVRSTWKDRTDVVVGIGQKTSEGTNSEVLNDFVYGRIPVTTTDRSKSTELKKLYVETLHPITQYDENAKRVVFVQGRIGYGGERIVSDKLENYLVPIMPAGVFMRYDHDKKKREALGVMANVGVGYRRLSEHENAYVGVNLFYDHAFKDDNKRISGGVEYVVGHNELYANIYQNVGSNNRKYKGIRSRSITWYDPDGLYPYGRDNDTSVYNYAKIDYENHYKTTENVSASGFDIGYARTFKNARWARVYADYYNWRGRSEVRVGYDKLRKREAIRGVKIGAELHITPHLTLDAGYQTASHSLSGPYATLKYTIGTSKFAWLGGKHSESAITPARSKMLDKVRRSDLVVHDVIQERYDYGVTDVGL